MARSIWTGSIAFGLVHIPVEVHGAEEPDELSLTMLDKRDFSPVGYERINKKTGEKVAWGDIVRGYEYGNDEYVVLSDADLTNANVEATHTLDIVSFVDASDIDPVYFDKPYYLTPGKGGQKAYALLRDTLSRTGKAGVAKIVLRTRQHLAALLPKDDVLRLVLLRYEHELRSAKDLELPKGSGAKAAFSQKERDMAVKLVEGMSEPWKPASYKDEYRDDLLALVEKKAKAGEVNALSTAKAKSAPRPKAKVIDLVALLSKSLTDRKGRLEEQEPASGRHPSTARKFSGKKTTIPRPRETKQKRKSA